MQTMHAHSHRRMHSMRVHASCKATHAPNRSAPTCTPRPVPKGDGIWQARDAPRTIGTRETEACKDAKGDLKDSKKDADDAEFKNDADAAGRSVGRAGIGRTDGRSSGHRSDGRPVERSVRRARDATVCPPPT